MMAENVYLLHGLKFQLPDTGEQEGYGMPKVSIVMPLFNKGTFVHDAVCSILEQTFADFELIIIDDQSTDNSVEIISAFDDSRIRFYANSRNMGQADSVNNGIERAVGEFITFAHGDDVWLNNFLSVNVALMEEHPEVNICHARAHYINENDFELRSSRTESEIIHNVIGSAEVLKRLMKGSHIVTPTVFLRKGTFPYFNNRYVFSCDWDLWLRIAAAGNTFMFIDEPLIYYRVSAGNVTSTAMKTGVNIIEDYLTLASFFEKWPEYCVNKGMALKRLSMRTLRLSRDVENKETIFLYHKLAIVFYPMNLLNPIFYIYLAVGFIWGHKGMISLKKSSKAVSEKIRCLRKLYQK
jgi:glycosyltransferase involved in cell wall biosynthesis